MEYRLSIYHARINDTGKRHTYLQIVMKYEFNYRGITHLILQEFTRASLLMKKSTVLLSSSKRQVTYIVYNNISPSFTSVVGRFLTCILIFQIR